MNKDSILLLTKDAQCKSYYPCYGNIFYSGKTPNMDELCANGTKFNNFFTVAPSSAMSYLGMFTGKYPYELNFKEYVHLREDYEGKTLFDRANEMGYETHVFWDEHWYEMAWVYSRCYGKKTQIHYIKDLRQGVGPEYKRKERLQRNDKLAENTLNRFENEINKSIKKGQKQFFWVHLPHVLNGRTGYGDDVDLYDKYIGCLRNYFDDSNIFISADHGNMNGIRGKLRYGFDVLDPAINIPLITPRIEEMRECDGLTCNKDLFDIIFKRNIIVHDMIVVDSAYYGQPHRKTAIIHGKYRYIYNKFTNTEELYDVEFDPNQNFNLISNIYKDEDRQCTSLAEELFFYPYWDELQDIREKLKAEKDRIWRDLSNNQKLYMKIKNKLRSNKYTHAIGKEILKLCFAKSNVTF